MPAPSPQPLRLASNRNQARSSAWSVQSSTIPLVALSPAFSAASLTARKLSTSFPDDRVLDLGRVHPFALAVMDRDAENHAGSHVYYLRFAQ